MKLKTSLLILLAQTVTLFFIATVVFANTSGLESIVGGDGVEQQEDAPFMVQLPSGCGGSVIDSRWILTGAHCINKQYFYDVWGGDLNSFAFPERYGIEKTFIHPKYERILYDLASRYDFALVKLSTPIDFANSNLKKLRIADPLFAETGQSPGTLASVYGWGLVSENDRGPTGFLRFVQVPIVSMETANQPEVFNHYLDGEDSMLPAGYIEGGKDACSGDSGGPLIVTDSKTAEKVQVGIVSWGVGCAEVNKFGIYSKVSAAYDWIQKTMKENP